MTFKSLFGQFTNLSLNLVNFLVPRFHVSHLTHETFKLCLQNTLNMSKTTRVYFGALQLQYSGLGSNTWMGFLRTNDLSEVKNGELNLDFKVVIKKVGWWFAN